MGFDVVLCVYLAQGYQYTGQEDGVVQTLHSRSHGFHHYACMSFQQVVSLSVRPLVGQPAGLVVESAEH